MEIIKLPIEKINPAAYNPRVELKPGDSEYEKLKKSIEEFGYIDPLIWNKRTGNLVGGHQRFGILNRQGFNELEVSVVDLDLDREKALNIALNKISGYWDDEKLIELLQELESSPIGIELSGFDEDEYYDLLSQMPEDTPSIDEPVVDDGFDGEAAARKIKEPETKYGDVWKLGRHILVCGDATKARDVDRLMRGALADCIITDPPYNVAIKSQSKLLNQTERGEILNDDMSVEAFSEFLYDVFQNYDRVSSENCGVYVFHASRYQREFENAMNAANIEVRAQCIWVKNIATFSFAQYKWKHEPVFYAFKKGKAPSWYGDRKQTTVWRNGLEQEMPEPDSVWEVSRGDVSKYVHPTQKPLELIAIPLKNSSKEGDIVLDFFGGSGSTLMTCEVTGRECRTLELDPVFCDVIKQRFFEYTDIKPELIDRL